MSTPEDREVIRKALKAQQASLPKGSSTIVVQPISGVLPVMNLKSIDNWRAFFHQCVAVLVPILVTANIVSQNAATAWVPFVFAIADSVLSVGNTTDKVRRIIYALIGLLQTGGLVTAVLTTVAPSYVTIGGAVLAVASAFMARFYTPTTTMVPTA